MTNKWDILLVDDESDVLSVSKLAMRDFEVYGRPLDLHTAASKAEALEILSKETKWLSTLAVAFIDVVMETDTAGLELCQYIRDDLNNNITQLFIRTGQPGIAPERAVIDRYDINGYFTKAEATEDKLYSLVKSGVRQFLSIRKMQGALRMLDDLITAGDSRQKLAESFEHMIQGFSPQKTVSGNNIGAYLAVEGQAIVTSELAWDEKTAMKLKDKLDERAGTALGPEGDKYVRDEHNNLLIKVTSKPSQPETFSLLRTPFPVPDNVIDNQYFFLKSFAKLWARAE
jgi:CheY-like chemotaxis protein